MMGVNDLTHSHSGCEPAGTPTAGSAFRISNLGSRRLRPQTDFFHTFDCCYGNAVKPVSGLP
jgi:hypothetical protein